MLSRKDHDEQIIRRVLAGRIDDFAALVHRYLPAVRALARTRLLHAHEADDVAQDAFIKAYQELDGLRDPRKFGPWLFTITRHACANQSRSRARAVDREQAIAPEPVAGPPDVARAELHALVLEKLNALDQGEREVLLLHYFAGRRVREIATMLDISTAAAKKRLQRAREALGVSLMRALAPEFTDAEDRKLRVREIMQGIAVVPVAWQGAASGAGTGLAAASGGLGLGVKLSAGIAAVVVAILLSLLGGVQFHLPWMQWPEAPPASEQVAVRVPSASAASAPEPVANATSPAPSGPTGVSAPNADEDGTASPTRITVLDQRNRPAAGVPVRVFKQNSGQHVTDSAPVFERRTGEEGYVDAPMPLGIFLAEASRPGERALAQYVNSEFSENEEAVYLKLQPIVTYRGTVRDADGKPVAGAGVSPSVNTTDPEQLREWAIWKGECAATTDEHGAFIIADAPRFPSQLTISAAGHPTLCRQIVPVQGASFDIQFPVGARISGRVVDAVSGAPVPAVKLSVGGGGGQMVSDGDGRFASGPFLAGQVDLQISQGPFRLAEPWRRFQVEDGEHAQDVLVKVRRTGIIQGQLRDAESDEPVQANIQLGLRRAGEGRDGYLEDRRFLQTESDGAFKADELVPGTYVVKVSGDYWRDDQVVTVDWDSVVTVDGTVYPAATVSGTVVDAAGQPVGHAQIRLILEHGSSETKTNSDGTFRFTGRRPGEHIEVVAGDYPSGTPYTVPETGLSGIVVQQRPPKPKVQTTGLIAGTLRDIDGKVVTTGKVSLIKGEHGFPSETMVSADGRFEFIDLSEGSYKLYVGLFIVSGFATPDKTVELHAGERKMNEDIVSNRVGHLTISGRVEDPQGNGVAGIPVSAMPDRDKLGDTLTPRETVSSDDGSFIIPGLPKRNCALTATYCKRGVNLEHIPAGARNVVITLPAMAEVKGRVVDAETGEAFTIFEVAPITVSSEIDLKKIDSYARVYDAGGRFALPFEADKRKTVRVVARADGYAPAVATATVGPGMTPQEVVIKLTPAAVLRGRVVDSNGTAVSGARLAINALPMPAPFSAGTAEETDVHGRFAFSSIPDGPVELFVVHGDFAPAQVNITDRSHPLTIVLDSGGVIEGHVRNHGVPVANVFVQCHYTGIMARASNSQPTDNEGLYRFEKLPAGRVKMVADISSPDSNSDSMAGRMHIRLAQDAIVEPGQTTVVDFDTSNVSGAVEGRVKAAAGAVQDGDRIAVMALQANAAGAITFQALQITQGDGSYRIDVPPGEIHLLAKTMGQSTAYGTTRARATVTITPGAVVQKDFTLGGESGIVRCAVEGVKGRMFVSILEGDEPVPDDATDMNLNSVGQRLVWTQEVSSDGVVEATGIAPGTYTVAVGQGGEDRRTAQVAEVTPNGIAEVHLVAP